jgi:hypothetical protein
MPSCKKLDTNTGLCNMCVLHMPVRCVILDIVRTFAVAHKCAVSGRILYAPTGGSSIPSIVEDLGYSVAKPDNSLISFIKKCTFLCYQVALFFSDGS